MADNKQSFQAGQAAGKAEEKSSVLLDNIKGAAASAQASAAQAGVQVQNAAVGATEFVKEKTGMNKK